MTSSENHVLELKKFIFKELADKGKILSEVEYDKLDNAMFQSPSSLRLRNTGYLLLKTIYDNEKFPLEKRLTGRELLTLKNDVAWPYFLPAQQQYIVLFTIKESFLLKLQGGNVKKWLKQIHDRKSNKNK
jgi:hypothetical protein